LRSNCELETVEKPCEIRAFKLIDCRQDVACEFCGLGWKDVDNDERGQRPKCGDRAIRVGKSSDRITADNDKCRDVSRLDFRNKGGAGIFAKATGEMWPTFWPGFRSSVGDGQRSGIELKEVTRVEPHAAGTVVRIGDYVECPQQVFSDICCRRHRDARACECADSSGTQDRIKKGLKRLEGEMAIRGDDFIVEAGDVFNKSFVVSRSLAQRGRSRVATQEISDEPAKHEPIGSGCELQVVICECRSFRSTRIDDPDRTSVGLKLSESSDRIGDCVRVTM
jgi:hypothetical protein